MNKKYITSISTNDLVVNNLYSYQGKEVIYERYSDEAHVFYDHNDNFYYLYSNNKQIKVVAYLCPEILINEIPICNMSQLVNDYKAIKLNSELLEFQNYIAVSLFVSLYRIVKGKLVLVKNKDYLDCNKRLFNYYCETLPKSQNNFITYRAEYRINTNDMLNLIYKTNEINFEYPFSTTYNLDFALNWLGSNIIYVINVPADCNYMLIKNNAKQFEITLQQGKLIITNKYKLDHNNKKYYIFFCNFIPN